MFHDIFSNQVSKLKYIKQNHEFKFSFELEYSTMLLGEARFLLMDDCGNPLAVAIGSRLTRARHHVESILLIRSNIVGYLKNSHAFMCVSSGYTVYALLLSRCRVFCSFTGLTGVQGRLKGLRLEMGLLVVEVEEHPGRGGLQDYDWGC